ncbi:MAG: peptidylprolyl isomerase [Gammaproteobacteria bacterium]|nr:peptidylprolyl isomerase [Gammaproteobacteria bacterium]
MNCGLKKWGIFFISLSFFVHGEGLPSPSFPIDTIVAVVNNDVITRSELNERLKWIKVEWTEHALEALPQGEAEREVLEAMIRESIQTQMAERLGVKIDDQTVYTTLQNIAKSKGKTFEQFKEDLKQKGLDFSSLQKQVQREWLAAEVRQKHLLRQVSVAEQEITNALLANPKHLENLQYEIAYLAIPLTAKIEPVTPFSESHVLEIVEELKAGKTLADIAIVQTLFKTMGHPLQWTLQSAHALSELPTLFAQKILEMNHGEFSSPIKGENHWYILQLKKASTSTPYLVQQVNVRHILLKPNLMRSESAVQQELLHLRGRVLAGESFSELAKLYSEDILTVREGGDLKWVQPASLGPSFAKAIATLRPGEISQPFSTEQGWHIAQLIASKTEDLTLAYRREQALDLIRRKKFDEAAQNWLIEIRDQAFVEIRL